MTATGTALGTFNVTLTGLKGNTTYTIQAYATTVNGETGVGIAASFTTPAPLTIATLAATSITGTTAISGGSITNDGGLLITQRGVCWNTSASPTLNNSFSSNGTGTGNFVSNLSGLTIGTLYHIRAYAKTAYDTTYGIDLPFTTLGPPSLITNPVTNITASSANMGGNITDEGGTVILEKGICWATTPAPTTSNNYFVVAAGTGTGNFTANITGLLPNTTYYVRSYAKNAFAAKYGGEISFSTAGYVLGSTGPAGGFIFYDKGSFSNGWRYLEAAPSDINATAGSPWGCSGTSITGAAGTAIGSGKANTLSIINGCITTNIAARLCNQFSINGYSDWFLPSNSELDQMYQNLRVNGLGAFLGANYWSSTQLSGTTANTENFASGVFSTAAKTSVLRVRPIRMF